MLRKDVRHQLLATLCCNIITVAYGSVCGWPSASLPVLQDAAATPLASGPLTVEQASWVGALMCAGGFTGNWIFVYACERFGRKLPLIVVALVQTCSWLLIIVATVPTYLYVARFLSGIAGGGVFVLVPMFVTEIADDRVRGALGSLLVFSCNIGYLLAFVLGNYFAYTTVPWILLGLPVVFVVCFAFMPESPMFLVQRGRDAEAARALRFYRNVPGGVTAPKTVQMEDADTALAGELEKLKAMYQMRERIMEETTTIAAHSAARITGADFCTPVAKRALLLGLGLVSLNQFSGCFAMLNYTATIFAESGTDMTPNMAAIVIGVIQLAGAYFSTVLVERAGRKFLLAFSALGTAGGLVSLGVYAQLKEMGIDMSAWSWLPVVSFAFAIFIASWGVLTLPFLVVAELMPEKIRAVGTSICISTLWVFAFVMVKWFPILRQLIGMHGSMYLFTGCCVTGALFVVLMLPETKGKSFDEIAALLVK